LSPKYEKIAAFCVFLLFFSFLVTPTAHTNLPILTLDDSNEADFCRDMLSWGYMGNRFYLGVCLTPNPQLLGQAYDFSAQTFSSVLSVECRNIRQTLLIAQIAQVTTRQNKISEEFWKIHLSGSSSQKSLLEGKPGLSCLMIISARS
jgi:hypothetical protein